MAKSAKSKAKTSKKGPVRSSRAKTHSSTRKTSSTKARRSSSVKQVQQRPVAQPLTLSLDQKLNIVGIILMLLGALTLFSLLSASTSKLLAWWSGTLYHALGWGAYIIPLLLLIVGLWLLFRKIEKMPEISAPRIAGMIILFFNLLAWFHLIPTELPANLGSGGGSIGEFIYRAFLQWFGTAGAIIWLIAGLLVSLILLVDLSLADLTNAITKTFKWIKNQIDHLAARRAAQKEIKRQITMTASPSGATDSFTGPDSNGSAAQKSISSAPKETIRISPPWVLPDPEEILNPVSAAPVESESDQDRARVIEETLRSFGTPAQVVEIRRGPAITLFGVEPDYVETRNGKTRVRVSNIVRLADDLAMALKASRIRIQAPVPGKGYVGIEVPNLKTELVSLLEIVQSPAFATNPDPLKFALGKSVAGQPFVTSLSEMPHLLIAGTTNSGKSVCINAILAGYLLTLTPDQIRFVLVDPKRVELTSYNGVPHLLAPVIVDAEKVVGALQWMQREMDLRYRMFAESGVRNLNEYNALQVANSGKTLPYLVVVIDELADMMMLAPDETERALTRLAQLARATGIHLILATQRPSTDIITGLIKANFPARIAFAVASGVDSRVILDQTGAERLLGRGDMLFQAPDAAAPVRLQGTFVSDAEINRLVEFWREQALQITAEERPDVAIFSAQNHPPLIDSALTQQPLWQELEKETDSDPIAAEALKIIRQEGRASVSLLQRKLRIGYTRAARIIEDLEEKGIVGPPDPQTSIREVLDFGEYGPLNKD